MCTLVHLESIRLYSLRNTLNLVLVTAVTKKSVLIVMCIKNLMKLLKKPTYNNPRLYLIPW
eukprot:SAG11_NODE_36386_length_261_cov_10.314815_1_plen_60_part_10